MRDLNTIKSCSEVYRKVFCPISELSKKNFVKNCSLFYSFFPFCPGDIPSQPVPWQNVKVPSQPIPWQDFELKDRQKMYFLCF